MTGTRDSKAFWSAVSKLVKPRSQGGPRPPREECESTLTKIQKVSEAEEKRETIEIPVMYDHPFSSKNILESQMKLTKIIRYLGKYKASGTSGVPNAVLSLAAVSAAKYLSWLYRRIFESGIMPKATITSIPKTGLPTDLCDEL